MEANLFGVPEAELPRAKPEVDYVPQNAWLVQQERSREQRKGRYVEDVFHSQKMPPELARRCLEHMKLPAGALIHDSFAGTGTTLVEALEMGYRVSGCDIVPSFVEKGCIPNLELAMRRAGLGCTLCVKRYEMDGTSEPCELCADRPLNIVKPYDVRVGDAIRLDWIETGSVDGGVCSPAYGDCDPSRDSNGRTIKERAEAGEEYANFVIRTSGYKYDATALKIPGAMGNMSLGEWDAMMFLAFREYRRILKNDAFLLVAVREFFRRKSAIDLVDLPGRTMQIGMNAGLYPYDIIYALDCAVDEYGKLKSRGSLHQNRIARRMADRPCPRGVPGVTRVLIFQRRVRKKPTRRPRAEPVLDRGSEGAKPAGAGVERVHQAAPDSPQRQDGVPPGDTRVPEDARDAADASPVS
jgi:hypothetical protein